MPPSPDDDVVARTVRSYDNAAAAYAKSTESFATFPGLREALEDFERVVRPGEAILDAGCGGGRDARHLADQFGRTVIALDASGPLLCTWHVPPAARIVRLRADFRHLPLKSSVVGGVWACASLLHLPLEQLPATISGISRVLKPGGVLACSFRHAGESGWIDGPDIGSRWYTVCPPDELIGRFIQGGLVDVSCSTTGDLGWYVCSGTRPH